MSSGEAAQMARLRLEYPDWRIERAEDGFRATHRRTGEQLHAASTGALEWEMRERGARRFGQV